MIINIPDEIIPFLNDVLLSSNKQLKEEMDLEKMIIIILVIHFNGEIDQIQDKDDENLKRYQEYAEKIRR